DGDRVKQVNFVTTAPQLLDTPGDLDQRLALKWFHLTIGGQCHLNVFELDAVFLGVAIDRLVPHYLGEIAYLAALTKAGLGWPSAFPCGFVEILFNKNRHRLARFRVLSWQSRRKTGSVSRLSLHGALKL